MKIKAVIQQVVVSGILSAVFASALLGYNIALNFMLFFTLVSASLLFMLLCLLFLWDSITEEGRKNLKAFLEKDNEKSGVVAYLFVAFLLFCLAGSGHYIIASCFLLLYLFVISAKKERLKNETELEE